MEQRCSGSVKQFPEAAHRCIGSVQLLKIALQRSPEWRNQFESRGLTHPIVTTPRERTFRPKGVRCVKSVIYTRIEGVQYRG